ncbi:hypothetical protein L249_4723 [Ophiocordyceps polyrhachis-furcata BCC 54312]|uniref:Transmembrane protein n=1 Tax=Ophiocordyceps polyrhachis-furcata BCC 54312 TaxID=1330021 RepID=A0A367L2W7_9HYPO|nr:hypothetical protein L249_4723 [Ophiocordyceps polyrhachis-furcata BCC 54312]
MKLPQPPSLIPISISLLTLALALTLNLSVTLAIPTPNHQVTILVPMRLLDNKLVPDTESRPVLLPDSNSIIDDHLPPLVWNPDSSRLFLYSMTPERRPLAVVVILLWVLATCWYFLRPYDSDDEEEEDGEQGGVHL